jgi:hypothetical protein|tara:strand:+ start:210 stop:662 length:453 start_codon:yes stop_codon:yes gene_type:complete
MSTHWVFRVGDGTNFKNSSRYKIWGIQSTTNDSKCFIKNVKPGDILWFITNKSQGLIIAASTYRSHNKREFGPLLDISMTNTELGWTNDETDWISDIEIHYTDLYNVSKCELLTKLKRQSSILRYNQNCCVELPVEYSSIVRYSKVTTSM